MRGVTIKDVIYFGIVGTVRYAYTNVGGVLAYKKAADFVTQGRKLIRRGVITKCTLRLDLLF